MKLTDCSLGYRINCDGKPYSLKGVSTGVEGLFEITSEILEDGGCELITSTIKNISGKALHFQRAFFEAFVPPGPYDVLVQSSKWANESMGNWQSLNPGGLYLSHYVGRTTEGNTPYLAMRQQGARGGMCFHLLPYGDWRIRVAGETNNQSMPRWHVCLGPSDDTLDYELKADESWTLPLVILQQFNDFGAASGALHRFLRKAFPFEGPQLPVEYNTWLDVYDNLDVDRMRSQLAVAKEIGCEVFVVDAGWFGMPGKGWWECVGNWHESTSTAFMGQMAAFADEVRAAGLQFGLWIEPERFMKNVPVVEEHPEWFTFVPETGCMRLHLDNPQAYEYQKNTFLRLIDDYGLTYIKTDMNGALGIDETGTAHYRYARLFYALLDEVRALRPQVVLEGCASGAMRNDIETMKHYNVCAISDESNPYKQMDIVKGFWQRFLPGRLLRWAVFRQLSEEVPYYSKWVKPVIVPNGGTWDQFVNVEMESMLAASFTGGQFGMSCDLINLTQENRDLCAKYISLFKQKREFMRDADGYILYDTSSVLVLELAHDGNAILIVRHQLDDAPETRTVYPYGLIPDATYCIEGKDYSGEELMTDGLTLNCLGRNDRGQVRCRLVMIERKQ